MCHFYRYRPSFSDGVLQIMNFGAKIVYCIRLETWFYVDITFKYVRFVFSNPQKSLYFEFGSPEFQVFEGPKSVFHFYLYGPSLSDDVLHIINFGAQIVHCIGLETWFHVYITSKYGIFCVFLVPKRVFILNLSLPSSNF